MNRLLAVMLMTAVSFATVARVSADAPQDDAFAQQRLSDSDMAELLGSLPAKSTAAVVESSPAILATLAGLEWGMSSQQAMTVLASDAKLDAAKLRKSYVTFDGQATKWEDSAAAGHYTHGNAEAMLVVDRKGVRTHLFFIQDKLWKTFEPVAKKDATTSFQRFARGLRGRFGGGHIKVAGEDRWIEFGSKRTRVRGVDGGMQAERYGVVLEDRPTLDKLSTMRVATIVPVQLKPVPPVVITPAKADVEALAKIVAADKARAKVQAPSAKVEEAAAAAKLHVAPPTTTELDAMAVVEDDDPLTGL